RALTLTSKLTRRFVKISLELSTTTDVAGCGEEMIHGVRFISKKKMSAEIVAKEITRNMENCATMRSINGSEHFIRCL
ncbi:hypothetical protein PFISCL1PPCAC_21447, partial [Pristionchus fissidentatus]